MAIVELNKIGLFFSIRKVLKRDWTIYPDHPYLGGGFSTTLLNGIYQMMPINGRRVCVRRDFYDYVITHTEAQQAQREKYYLCFPQWNNLTSEQKNVYNKKAYGKQMSGYNLFMKDCLNG